ncbi:50S ribosomal protein L3 [Candidatus Woesearchaeota archaeon]|nr:50S ribosomal protein L3 [Candidatus Woesearchaeota archaeon]
MSKTDGPRHGSMQFWPRKRASKLTPRLRSRTLASAVDGFYGYKVGMTQVSIKDSGSNSLTKNEVIVKPVTIVECPPLKVAGIRFYKKNDKTICAVSDVFADKLDKELSRKLIVPKSKAIKDDIEFDDLRLIVYTQPKLTSIGKKKPEVFELALAGNKEEKLAYAKERLGKEISVAEALKENELIDVHGVTTGKGYQGPVKRFGIQIRQKKSEKTKRGPGSLGPWCGQQHIMYRVAHAGQTGFFLRTEMNKPILKIDEDVSKVNPKGGFVNYGNVRSTYVLILGSILGPNKRMLRLTHAARPNPKKKTGSYSIVNISKISKQR